MAFTTTASFTGIDLKKKLSALPEGLSTYVTMLQTVIGISDDVQGIEKLYTAADGSDGLLKVTAASDESLKYEVANKALYSWVFQVGDSDTAGSVVFFKAEQFNFEQAYALDDKTLPLSKPAFWKDCWIFFCDQDQYTLPASFLKEIVEQLPSLSTEINEKSILLKQGLNCIHKWEIQEAVEQYTPGPFSTLFGDEQIILLANEEAGGMVFSLLLENLNAWTDDHFIGQFLKLDYLSLSLFNAFATEEFPVSQATLGAHAKFFDQGCWIEANLPKKGSNGLLSLSIYPDQGYALAPGGFPKLLSDMGLGNEDSLEIGDSFPKLDFAIAYLKLEIGSGGINHISTEFVLNLEDGKEDPGYEVVKDLFTIYQVFLQVQWRRGSGVSFTVGGGMNAFSYDFALSYNYPTHVLQGKLAPGVQTEGSIKKLIKSTGAPEVVGDAIATVATSFEVSFYADVDDQEFEISFSNHQEWKLGNFLTIESLNLRLEFFDKWGFTGASLSTLMSLPIGETKADGTRKNVHIDILADYDKDANLWSFEGNSAAGEGIAVGEAINALASKITDKHYELPDAVSSLLVDDISLYFDSDGKVAFRCHTTMMMDGEEVQLWVHLNKAGSEIKVSGSLFLYGIQLGVAFKQIPYTPPEGGSIEPHKKAKGPKSTNDRYVVGSLMVPLSIASKALIEAVAPQYLAYIPFDVNLQLKGLLIGMHDGGAAKPSPRDKKASSNREFLFRLAFDLDVGLEGIPLIGSMLPEGIGFVDGQLIAANKSWADKDIGEVNGLLGEFKPQQPAAFSKKGNNPSKPTVEKGISLSGAFRISDDLKFPMFLHFGGDEAKEDKGKTENQGKVKSGSKGKSKKASKKPASKPNQAAQQKVDRTLGPLIVRKVALIFEDGQIGVKFSGGFGLAAFEFELIGLQVTVPQETLSDPSQVTGIQFGLDGFSTNIQKGTLLIAGAFLRKHYPQQGNVPAYDEFNGAVTVSFPPFALAGLGSYAKYNGDPSLFLFVSLGFPISITPAFIIQGMSLGFGIHRDFIPPRLDRILEFPLIQLSVTPPQPIDLVELVDSLSDYFPPTTDQFFVVAGLKFKAFGLVDNLIMLAIKFGQALEMHVLGLSSIFLGGVFVELGWTARFLPEKGEFFLGGQLTDRSYLLVPNAQLTGGFAVQIWTKGQNKGDFVVSIGGYHPQYKVPAHYPNHIKRLGVSFEMGSVLSIKGGLYFAVTPEAIMMGGRLEAAILMDPLEGHLNISLDALLYFQPFRYDLMIAVDAEIKAELDVKLTTISIHEHLHLDVHVWGPDFAGKAYLDVGPKTFSVSFGGSEDQKILPVAYPDFKKKFLPNVLSASVTKGIIGKGKDNGKEVFIVNAKELEIEVNSVVPLTKQEYLDAEENRLENIYQPGITPMNLLPGKYLTELGDLVPTGNKPGENDQFQYPFISSNIPTAIWGDEGLKKSVDKLKKNALTGYIIKPKKAQEAEGTHAIDKKELAWNTDPFDLTEGASALEYNISSDDSPDTDVHISNNLEEDLMEAFTGLTTKDTFKEGDFLYKPIHAEI